MKEQLFKNNLEFSFGMATVYVICGGEDERKWRKIKKSNK
jgi:hypothetical protein